MSGCGSIYFFKSSSSSAVDGVGHLRDYLPLFAAQGGEVLTVEPHLAGFVGLAALEGDEDRSEVGGLRFENNRAAFDCAVRKLKEIIY